MGIDETYRRLFPIIREKCARMLRDPAEAQDVAQETFVRLWRADLSALEPQQVTAWIYRTSTRLAIDRARRRRVRAAEPMSTAEEAADSGALAADRALAFREEWRQLAESVPARELEIAVLARVDGLTQRELSEVTGVTDRTIRRLLARFEERLERLRQKKEQVHVRA